MKKFKLEVEWKTEGIGSVTLDGFESEESAIDYVKENSKSITKKMVNAKENTEITNITGTKEMEIKETINLVNFYTVWDDSNAIVETDAKYNTLNGVVFDIESTEDVEELCRLDETYIDCDGEILLVYKKKDRDNNESYVTLKDVEVEYNNAIALYGDNCTEVLLDEDEEAFHVGYHSSNNSFTTASYTFEGAVNFEPVIDFCRRKKLNCLEY